MIWDAIDEEQDEFELPGVVEVVEMALGRGECQCVCPVGAVKSRSEAVGNERSGASTRPCIPPLLIGESAVLATPVPLWSARSGGARDATGGWIVDDKVDGHDKLSVYWNSVVIVAFSRQLRYASTALAARVAGDAAKKTAEAVARGAKLAQRLGRIERFNVAAQKIRSRRDSLIKDAAGTI